MSYDTEHVRNVGNSPGTISGIPIFAELLANTNLASLYTSIRHGSPVSAPDLVETADVSKKTVYEYLDKLEQAGLIIKTGDEGRANVYNAEDFELTLTIQDVVVSITPELVEGIAHAREYPVLDRVLEDHGLTTFALGHDLIKTHSNGDVTTRQIVRLTELSPGTTYDLLEAVYEIHDLGATDASPTTYTPDDVTDEADDLLGEFPDQ
jgi:predicted transcriptional regulator